MQLSVKAGGGGGGGSRSKILKNGGSGGLPPEIPRKFEKSSAQGGGGIRTPPDPPSLCTPLDNSMLTGFHLYNTASKTAADEHAPSIKTKKRRACRNLLYTNEIHAQRVTRRKYERMWIKSRLEIHKQMYHIQSFKVVDMITKAKEKYYMEALSDTQPKYMFRVVGTLLSTNKKRYYPASPT